MSDEHRPRFDPTVNLGHLITFVGFIVSGLVAFFSVKGELETVKSGVAHIGERTGRVEAQIDRVTQLMLTGTRLETELTEVKRRLDKLERQ